MRNKIYKTIENFQETIDPFGVSKFDCLKHYKHT